MVIVDTALARRAGDNNPIKVVMVGAGFMAKGIALQICKYAKGMQLVAISNRNIEKAKQAYMDAGILNAEEVTTIDELENNIARGICSFTSNAKLLCEAGGIDALIEVTGTVEFGADIVLSAIRNKKHVILMNAELDGTAGPILKVYADRAGVVYTNSDGDQPGVIMNLYRFVKAIGVKPVLCGNIKGLHDPYRNPTTQIEFARKWAQKPEMVSSFADGSKISFEQAIVANGTGMRVARRGMYGPTLAPGSTIKDVVKEFPVDELLSGNGIVDYVVGVTQPAPGVFVLGTIDDPVQKRYLELYKLGEGPIYLFYTPYHLCHFEVPITVARTVLFKDATLTPIGKPFVEVITMAKMNLKEGQVIDGMGCYMTYGVCENADIAKKQNLLPIGVAEGCLLKRDLAKDEPITYNDVILPAGRLIDKLREEQDEYFNGGKLGQYKGEKVYAGEV
ncbi:MAG TPA: Gfo/Idh/MocA family oxidoreductase [Chitinophagaceae bacterium]|nr:Gfo/Idh/MocA family oxidoreductase [Chitinophagaceae bacterium]